ncbi:DUF6134 family protein [Cognatitamlana onchidii]|uniref:DUF6134 family protein n=1 Tax=Cognatitamlana onchidii TaxID=2562860 RepID=UPI0010A62E2D|nr:DUF6134 family protein [Algibacter onchidii]
MIPMLILYLLRRLDKTSFLYRKINDLKKLVLKLKVLLVLVIAPTLYAANINPDNIVKYNVVRNNKVIGTIQITCNSIDDAVTYILESNIKAKYILSLNISGKEISVFKNGFLVYSSVLRTLNNKTKTNHTIIYKNGQYQLEINDEFKRLGLDKIQENLVSLYFSEPKDLKYIFCDNLKQMVNIQSLGKGKYKVSFSNGKHNIFHYKEGKCIKIEANSSLFSVTLIPVKP